MFYDVEWSTNDVFSFGIPVVHTDEKTGKLRPTSLRFMPDGSIYDIGASKDEEIVKLCFDADPADFVI